MFTDWYENLKKYGSTFYGIEDVNAGTNPIIQSKARKALENVSKDGMVYLQLKDGIN